jgi:hypothetical protein
LATGTVFLVLEMLLGLFVKSTQMLANTGSLLLLLLLLMVLWLLLLVLWNGTHRRRSTRIGTRPRRFGPGWGIYHYQSKSLRSCKSSTVSPFVVISPEK